MERNKSTIIFMMVCSIGFSGPLCAQDNNDTDLFGEVIFEHKKIVVTASRVPELYENVASSVTIIDNEMIEQRKVTNVLDLLRTVPGIHIAQNGAFGQKASIFMRGTNPEHTVIMINGVRLNDPLDPSRAANISNLQVTNIERIEILRGAHSTIYGADAIGGVINIITKKGDGPPVTTYRQEFGSYETFYEQIESRGKVGRVSYAIGGSRLDTDGISAANRRDGNDEDDGAEETTVSARVEVDVTDRVSVGGMVDYSSLLVDFDSGGGPGADNSNNRSRAEQTISNVYLEHQLTDDWFQRAEFGYMDITRRSNNFAAATFVGEIYRVNWQHNVNTDLEFLFLDSNLVVFGYDFENERGVSTGALGNETTVHSFYIQDRLRLLDTLNVSLGGRVDHHDKFGTQLTWKATGSYVWEPTGTKIKGTIGTGFKAPSLFQLFDVQFMLGNVNLNPEKSFSYDIGLEQAFLDNRIILGTTFFYNEIKDIIVVPLGFPVTYINSSKAEMYGFESFVNYDFSDIIQFRMTHTYLQTENTATGVTLLRRPAHEYNFNLNIHPTEALNINTNVRAASHSNDNVFLSVPPFTSSSVHLDSYVKADVVVSYDITKHFQVYVRAENITNEQYEDIAGFGTPGRSFFGGFELTY